MLLKTPLVIASPCNIAVGPCSMRTNATSWSICTTLPLMMAPSGSLKLVACQVALICLRIRAGQKGYQESCPGTPIVEEPQDWLV